MKNKELRYAKIHVRNVLMSDISFIKEKFIADDCPLNIIVPATTRNKISIICDVILDDIINNKNTNLNANVKRFLKLVSLHKYQLGLLRCKKIIKDKSYIDNVIALNTISECILRLVNKHRKTITPTK